MTEPDWPNVKLRPDRLPGHHLLLRAEAAEAAGRAWTRSTRSSGGPSRSSASRSTSRRRWPAWRWTRCSTASRWRRRSRRSWPSWASSSARSPRRCASTPTWSGKYLGSVVPLHRQLLRGAQLGGLQRRLVLLHPEGRALPDGAVHLLPHQRAEHRPVRAHADHRRRGRVRQLPRGLHGADARREPAARRGGRAGRARRRARSSTRRCRTGTRATRTARAASTTSSPSAASAAGANSKISWTQVETGSAITWKYPSCILQGDNSVGEFYSVAVTNNCQQADTGTKMIHIGKNTRSTIVSKGISAGHGQNTYRGLVKIGKSADGRAQLLAVRLAAASATSAARTRSRTSRSRTRRRRSSTRRRRRRSARTRSSTASSAASRPRTR